MIYVKLPKDEIRQCKEQYSLVEVVNKYYQTIGLMNPEEGLNSLIDSKYAKNGNKKIWILIDNADLPMLRGLRHGFLNSPELADMYSQLLLPSSWLLN